MRERVLSNFVNSLKIFKFEKRTSSSIASSLSLFPQKLNICDECFNLLRRFVNTCERELMHVIGNGREFVKNFNKVSPLPRYCIVCSLLQFFFEGKNYLINCCRSKKLINCNFCLVWRNFSPIRNFSSYWTFFFAHEISFFLLPSTLLNPHIIINFVSFKHDCVKWKQKWNTQFFSVWLMGEKKFKI